MDPDRSKKEALGNALPSSTSPPSVGLLVLAFAAVYVIWGSTYLAIRFAIETLPPFLMAATRFLAAGALLYAASRQRAGEKPSSRQWLGATVVGGLMLFGGNGGVVWAEQWVPSGLTALIVATVPLWMVILEWIGSGRTRPTPLTAGGLILGFVGVAILVGGEGGLQSARVPWVPAAVLLLASGSWAAGSLYSRSAPMPRSPLLATAMQMIGGGAVLLVAGLVFGEAGRVALREVSLRSALSLTYLVVFGSIVAFTAYIWLLRVSTPARVSTYAYVNPVVAVVLGWALAGEPLTPRVGLATVLIVVAVFAVVGVRRC